MADSNGAWGTTAAHSDALAAVVDTYGPLPDAGESQPLDSYCVRHHIDIPALVRLGARWEPPNVIAYPYAEGVKFVDVVTNHRWSYVGSRWGEMKIVLNSTGHRGRIAIVAEGEPDGARLTMLYPEADVAVLPAGADPRPHTAAYVKQLSLYDLVLLGHDNDQAGEDGAALLAEHLTIKFLRWSPPEVNDWCDLPDDFVPTPLPDPDAVARPRPRWGRSAADLLSTVPEEPAWLVPGAVAEGWMVKVAGREKVGKGELVIVGMLGPLERAQATVFGAAAPEPHTALIFTEEPEDSIREKIDHAGLKRAYVVFGYELAGMTWQQKVDALLQAAVDDGHSIVFMDNVSRAAQVTEESGVELARAAEYLGERAKAHGLTVILDHHHRKAGGKLEDKSRGGTALAGACDNNLEVERLGEWDSRLRRVSSRGRISSTIWQRTIALDDDARGYSMVADDGDPTRAEDRERLAVFRAFDAAGITVPDFMQAFDPPLSESTARRTLNEFVEMGLARKEGNKPATYFPEPQI